MAKFSFILQMQFFREKYSGNGPISAFFTKLQLYHYLKLLVKTFCCCLAPCYSFDELSSSLACHCDS